MQNTLLSVDSVNSVSLPSGIGNGAPPSVDSQARFENMLADGGDGISGKVSNIINSVEAKLNAKHVDIVNNLKNFEQTGGAVALMMANHQGSNNSIMVQLVGTVSKKCADNTEQIYKQQ